MPIAAADRGVCCEKGAGRSGGEGCCAVSCRQALAAPPCVLSFAASRFPWASTCPRRVHRPGWVQVTAAVLVDELPALKLPKHGPCRAQKSDVDPRSKATSIEPAGTKAGVEPSP
eukprot:365563-Chlamydomonas_euryale.AAC.5